jgi:hypothetical protein
LQADPRILALLVDAPAIARNVRAFPRTPRKRGKRSKA